MLNGKRQLTDSNDKGSEQKFQRVFGHVDGNWPSHVRINLSSRIAKVAKPCLHHLQQHHDQYQVVEEKSPHISLSKPFVLRSHHIAPYIASLQRCLSQLAPEPLCIDITAKYHVLVNETETRAFVCVPIDDRAEQFSKLIAAVDIAMTEFMQPVYYSGMCGHGAYAIRMSNYCMSTYASVWRCMYMCVV